MKWKKLGKIFDPTEHKLLSGCKFFAQSPQVVELEDSLRVYFSTREYELSTQKYLSHVAFVDFRKDFSEIIGVSQHNVIPLGDLGAFDEHGIFPANVLPVGDELYAYTTGWSRRHSVSVETGIGIAISKDNGRTFNKLGNGPILTSSLDQPCLVADAFVIKEDDLFHMWYIYGSLWQVFEDNHAPDRTYKIAHATSVDGIEWAKDEKNNIVKDVLGNTEAQALPSVIELDGTYHMVFCYRESFDFRAGGKRSYRIGHASSSDLVNWRRDDSIMALEPGDIGEWDSEMQCYPHLFKCQGHIYLLYNGNEFGKFGFGLAKLEL